MSYKNTLLHMIIQGQNTEALMQLETELWQPEVFRLVASGHPVFFPQKTCSGEVVQ